ncbi:heavy-metal-associated domain-containing protein [Pseudomonas defluvii]|uniref:heavy-metal-associated domain-containing protein n=1 Tax=Pseudomonas defluvii TaxID=1876757 RepID=UPI0039061A01
MHVFNVQGMTCGHCVKAVTHAVQNQDPTAVVEVDLGQKQVRVQSTLTPSKIIELIHEEGYQAEVT